MIQLTLSGKTLTVTEDELVKHIDECKHALTQYRTGNHAPIMLNLSDKHQDSRNHPSHSIPCEY